MTCFSNFSNVCQIYLWQTMHSLVQKVHKDLKKTQKIQLLFFNSCKYNQQYKAWSKLHGNIYYNFYNTIYHLLVTMVPGAEIFKWIKNISADVHEELFTCCFLSCFYKRSCVTGLVTLANSPCNYINLICLLSIQRYLQLNHRNSQ